MNVINILALICGLFTLFACKPAEKAPEESSPVPRLEKEEKMSLKNLDAKPSIEATQLKVDSLSLSAHSIDNNKAALVSFDATEGIAEYYMFEFCPQENPENCTKGWYHDSDFIVPGLKPGTYKFSVKACIRKEKAVTEPCGASAETYYEQAENHDNQLAANILRFFSLLPKAQNISFEVLNALLIYKQQLKEAGHEEPKDDIEVAINNILELGPYQNSAYYLSDGFDTVRDSILEQQSGKQESLQLTETDYEKYHKPDPNEPSTFGKIMILGGLAAVVVGFGQFPSFYQTSPQKQLDDYRSRVKNPDLKKVQELQKKIKNYPSADELKKVNSKKYRKGFTMIIAGFAVFFAGFSTRANLVEDSNSLESIRNTLLAKLEVLEMELVEIVRERKALAEEIPF